MLDISTPTVVAHALPPVFHAFPKMRALPEPQRSRLISPGTTIYAEGTARAPLYKLLDGCVTLTQSLGAGRRQILDVIGPGRLFGLAHGTVNHCSAEARAYSEIEPVGHGMARVDIEQALLETLRRAQGHATLLGRKTAMEKVATAVVDLARQFERPCGKERRRTITFSLHLTRADLGDWLGLTVETVSRYLNQLKRDGIIDFSHPEIVSILDPRKLNALAVGSPGGSATL